MGKQVTPMVRDSYEAEFRIMRNELESAKQVTANALIEYARIRDINADLLQALEAVSNQLKIYGTVSCGGAIDELVIEAIARARGQA